MKKKKLFFRLYHYMGIHKFTIIVSIITAMVSSFVGFSAYISVFNVAKELLSSSNDWSSLDVELLQNYGWDAVKMIGISFGLYGLSLASSHLTAFSVVAKLRIKLLHHLAKIPLGYHVQHSSGEVRKVIEKNTSGLESYIAHQIPNTVQAISTPVALVVCMFYFDWKLSLISLIPIIIGFLILMSMLKGESVDFLEKYDKAFADMSNAIVEYVRGISVVKVFGQTAKSFQRFSKAVNGYHDFLLKYSLSMENTMSAYTTVVHSIFAFLTLGSVLLFNNFIDKNNIILSFIFFVVITPLVVTMLMRIMSSSSETMISSSALDIVEGILNEQEVMEASDCKIVKAYDIDFDSVSFKYDNKGENIINNLSFKAKEGTVTALVGPSGSGKSTVASLIGRFWDVDEGSIKIGGIDVRNINYQDWMQKISIVFQDVQLFKGTIEKNVSFSNPSATREDVLEALHQAQCDDIIAKFPNGIDTVIGSEGVYLSGGEMQRISLARAILKDTPVIILDEATAFADAENEYKIQKALDNLMKNKTVIMIAHRLSTITNADQILLIDNGELIEQGTHKELMDLKGRYNKMFNEYQNSASWKFGGVVNA